MEPHSLVGGMGEGSWSNWGLACGLQDQRLMARPPARAGGRSGLLTGGESGNPNGYSLPFSQRVPSHIPSPPSRWAGRYGPFAGRAAGQVFRKKYSLPPHTHQRRESRGKNLFPLGFFPPFLPKKWGPGWASHGSPPFQRRRRETTKASPSTCQNTFTMAKE